MAVHLIVMVAKTEFTNKAATKPKVPLEEMQRSMIIVGVCKKKSLFPGLEKKPSVGKKTPPGTPFAVFLL